MDTCATLDSRLRELCEAVAVEHALPGFAVGVRSHGREIFADGFGTRDAEATLPVLADTVFGVASVTKLLTTNLLMQMRERGRIALSDPVSRFYPDLRVARDGRMSVHHLLSHSAGFPGLPFRHMATSAADPNVDKAMLTPADLVNGINTLDFEMLAAPGDRVSYSNEGYCLLGGIIEDLYGCSFADAAEAHVFRPLQIESGVLGAPDIDRQDNLATPVVKTDAGLRACGFWDAPLFVPTGGLATSVRDMTRLISILAGTTSVLSAQGASDMVSTSLPVASRPLTDARYGLGLEITALDARHTLAWHTGQRPGISSFVGHVLERDVSVAFAAKIADAPSATIGHRIIAEVLQDTLEPGCCVWPPRAAQIAGPPPERFAGRFGSPEIGELLVRRERDRLVLEVGSAEHELRFEGPVSGTVAGQTFCFLDADHTEETVGAATALALDLRVLQRLPMV